jgi:two-component system, NarL family, sensor histidine kinase UhpB
VDRLPPDLNITVYRLIQECLTNAVRHSRARMIAIRLSLESAGSPAAACRLLLDVTESEMTANGTAVGASGAGLLGMRERVEAHGGELTVDFDPAGGLSLHAWMPVVAQSPELVSAVVNA